MAQLIALVVAMDEQQVIGYRNQLPWSMPADLHRFKAITMGKPITRSPKYCALPPSRF